LELDALQAALGQAGPAALALGFACV